MSDPGPPLALLGRLAASFLIGLLVSLLAASYLYRKTTSSSTKRLPLPPGPKGWPLVGNLYDLPPPGVREWEFWLAHKDKYGPLSSVTVLGTTIVVVHSRELAVELLEKRSAIYSARPPAVFSMELCGWENTLVGQTKRLRDYRRRLFEVIGTKARSEQFNGLQDREVSKFLFRALQDPDHFLEHIRTEVGAIILKLTYGYTIDTTKRDPLVDIAEKALEQFSLATVPGAWLVDIVPILRYLPEWVPGAGFQTTARAWKATLAELAERPMRFVRKQMQDKAKGKGKGKGGYTPSYVSTLYERAAAGAAGEEEMTADDEEVIKWTAASMFSAGADTSVGVLAIFFLAMITHPDVQARAQEEIDRVVFGGGGGPGGSHCRRLPTFADRPHLPYVEAVFQEAFRWHVLAPTSLPHVCTREDDVVVPTHQGLRYRIPRGAIVVPNVWWFAHDPAVYPRPDVFDPTRFLADFLKGEQAEGEQAQVDPLTYAFGFGRRVCPGKQFADLNIWLTMVRSLAVFNICKARDEQGVEMEPEVQFGSGLVSHPVPYRATVHPRSPEHARLIRQVHELHPEETSDAAELESLGLSV